MCLYALFSLSFEVSRCGWASAAPSSHTKASVDGVWSSALLFPAVCVIAALGQGTSGTSTGSSLVSRARSAISGTPWTRTALCWPSWCRAVAMAPRQCVLFKRLLKSLQYAPRVLVKLKSYGVVKRKLPSDVEHCQDRNLDNRAENSHRPRRGQRAAAAPYNLRPHYTATPASCGRPSTDLSRR